MSAAVKLLTLAAGLLPARWKLAAYRLPLIARTIRAALNAMVPKGPSDVEVAAGPCAGARLRLDLGREKALWLGTYEPWIQEVLVAHLRPRMHAWDVGGFIGYHTVLMCRLLGSSRVVAIEPDPGNRERLLCNLRLNGMEGAVIVPAAAGARMARGALVRVPGFGAHTRVVSGSEPQCEIVPLDHLLERFPAPALIKVDVEGMEGEVLRGAERLLTRTRPIWVLELHDEGGLEAVELLERHHYRLRRFGKGVDVDPDLPVGGPRHVLALP